MIYNDSIWYLSKRNSKQVFVCRDLNGRTLNTESMPEDMHFNFFERGSKSEFWFCGKSHKKPIVMIRNSKARYSKVEIPDTGESFPVYFAIQDSMISLIIGKIRGSIVEHELYKSFDSGLHWEKQDLAISTYVDPVSSYKKNLFGFTLLALEGCSITKGNDLEIMPFPYSWTCRDAAALSSVAESMMIFKSLTIRV